jgi:hypothetical protein
MIMEARAANCFSCAFVLKLNDRPIGKISVRWLSEGYGIQLIERRQLEFRRTRYMGSYFEMVDARDQEILAECQPGPLLSLAWDLRLSIGRGRLASTGWLETAHEFIQDEVLLARVNRLGARDVGWKVDADDVVRVDDLLMIGLVYHTAHHRYHYGWDQAGGQNAGS